MSDAKITLIGMLEWDNDVLSGLSNLPPEIDRALLESTIILRGGDFGVIYPDPNFLKKAVEVWALKWNPTVARWVRTLSIDYDPLNNYDRHEEYTDISDGTSGGKTESTGSTTNSGSTSSSTSDSGTDTTTNTVSAYDSATYQPHDKSETGYGKSTTGSVTTGGTTSSSDNVSTQGEDHRKSTHKAHIFGNVGVTTSQEMARQELELARFNLYDQIADLFLTEFVIPVYV